VLATLVELIVLALCDSAVVAWESDLFVDSGRMAAVVCCSLAVREQRQALAVVDDE
jgi:hypothetical protein